MRDPNRIKQLLLLLEKLWQKDPDLRFNQLLYNLQYEFSKENDGIGQVKEVESDGFTRIGFDLFNLEDDAFLEYLQAKVSGDGNE
ncbi:DUF1040 family protein [Aestuariibacter halophilus]|uniref:DUF1040 family protein n=1 Tax=Fluctibacter halophilus TaxID=226011 RepID=A0ABS8GDM2_9ALTE|nr:DUF1040 family protein [Aestuariibacter halophilus]MCC2618356.1 DUF1040 family protein [Aestuariibacter halophilus]